MHALQGSMLSKPRKTCPHFFRNADWSYPKIRPDLTHLRGLRFSQLQLPQVQGQVLDKAVEGGGQEVKNKPSQFVKNAVAWTQDDLIIALNNKIRGRYSYHDITVHFKEFREVDRHFFRILVR